MSKMEVDGDNISKHENKSDQINKKLQEISRRIDENQHNLYKYEKVEKDFFQINKQTHYLMDKLLYNWQKDKILSRELEEERQEIEINERKIIIKLEKEKLLHEKRRLSDLEDNLLHQQQLLKREEK